MYQGSLKKALARMGPEGRKKSVGAAPVVQVGVRRAYRACLMP